MEEKKMILEMTREENSGTQAAFLMLGFQLVGINYMEWKGERLVMCGCARVVSLSIIYSCVDIGRKVVI